jgi:hypothetical protein
LLTGTVNACYRPTPVIPGILVNFLKAATPVIPHIAIVLHLPADEVEKLIAD